MICACWWVPAAGAVEAGNDLWEPVRLIDSDGEPVVAVMAFLRELQASGRSAATQRSYAMDLLRWFRFGWAIDVGWDQATRVEAREFCRWLGLRDKPTRAGSGAATGVPAPSNSAAALTQRGLRSSWPGLRRAWPGSNLRERQFGR